MIKSDVQSGQIRSFNDPCDGRANSHLRRCPSRIPQVLTWKMAEKNMCFFIAASMLMIAAPPDFHKFLTWNMAGNKMFCP